MDERARLGKKRRPRRALASVDLVDEILRSAATDDLLLRYEDAVVDWGDAETWVLRTRASEPAPRATAQPRSRGAMYSWISTCPFPRFCECWNLGLRGHPTEHSGALSRRR